MIVLLNYSKTIRRNERERERERERENSIMCKLEKGKWREARFARGHCTARAKSF